MRQRNRSSFLRSVPPSLTAAGVAILCIVAQPSTWAFPTPLGTAFTYQGLLKSGGSPISGTVDVKVRLFDAAAAGVQIGAEISLPAVAVIDGQLNANLDFGALAFNGDARWIEIDIRSPAGGGAYTTLSPRQPVLASPYALLATSAASATNATQLNGQVAAYYQNAANLNAGTIPSARLAGSYTGALTLSNVSNSFTGSGAGLTNLPWGSLTGVPAGFADGIDNSSAFTLPYSDTTAAAANAFAVITTAGGRAAIVGIDSAPSGGGYGGWFETASSGGMGLRARASAASGVNAAGYFENFSTSTSSVALKAVATGGSGDTTGVWGQVNSPTGAAIRGTAAGGLAAYFEGGNVRIDNGSVGIGTNAPTEKLDVRGNIHMENPSTETAMIVRSANGIWLVGSNNGGNGNNNNQFHITDNTGSGISYVTLQRGSGNFGIGTSSPTQKLDVNGTAIVNVLTIRGGADLVEGFNTSHEQALEPGTVVVIDPANAGALMRSTQTYDIKVAGVVSGANGVEPGIHLGQESVMDGDTKVAMTGRVYVKCSTENGAIRPGDRLTTASLAGHAMKATDGTRSDGAVIGKAMSSLDEGTGLVLVLVNLQ